MIPINLTSLIANSSSPKYDPSYPSGNRSPIGNLIGRADWSNGQITPSSIFPNTSWFVGAVPDATVAVVNGVLEATYPPPTFFDSSAYASFSPPPNTSRFRATFRAKFTPGRAVKFFKIHGVDDVQGAGYANCTFQVGGDGLMQQISFGDGTSIDNDAQNVINLNGDFPSWIGRSYGTAVVETPQMRNFDFNDGLWHDIDAYAKFNDGTSAANEIPNGEFYLAIDGLVFVRATGLFNRHYSNHPIAGIEWLGYVNTDSSKTTGFKLSIDDISIYDGGMPT